MSNEARNLEIKVTIPADVSGGKETAKVLDAAKASAVDLDKELARLDAHEAEQKKKLDEFIASRQSQVGANLEAAKSSAGVSAEALMESVAIEKSTDATKDAAAAKKQFKEGLKGLAVQFPEFSRVAGLAMNPVVLALVAGSTAARLWYDRLQEIQAALTPSDWEDITSVLERKAAAVHNVQSALSYYRRSLEDATKASDGLVGSAERTIALMKEQSEWIKQNAEAEKDLALAKIDRDEKSGKLSPAAAVEARAKVNKDFRKASLEADLSGQAGEIDHKRKELNAIEGALPTLAEERERAGRELVNATREEEGFLGEKERAQQNLEITEKKLKELQELNRGSMFPSADATKAEFDTDEVAQRLREQLGAMDAKEAGISDRRREAEERLKRIQDEERAAIARRDALSKELPVLENSFGVKEGTGREILKKREQVEDIRTQTEIEEIRRQEEERRKREEAKELRNGGRGGIGPDGIDLSKVSDVSAKTVASAQQVADAVVSTIGAVNESNQDILRRLADLESQTRRNRGWV